MVLEGRTLAVDRERAHLLDLKMKGNTVIWFHDYDVTSCGRNDRYFSMRPLLKARREKRQDFGEI